MLAQLVGGIALARLLVPADFGLAAGVLTISAFALLFVDLGIGPAVVQRKDVSEELLASAFWLNALAGVGLTLLLAACSPLVAAFFHHDVLVPLTCLVSLNFTLSLGVVHLALLERGFRFRAVGAIDAASAVTGMAVSVLAAWLGAGVYALALGPLSATVTTTVLCWAAVPWRPRHFASRPALGELWAFSSWASGFNLVNYWSRNADNLFIGHSTGAEALGFYSKAYNLMLLPVTQATQVLARVMLPAFATMQDDVVRLRMAYRRYLRLSVLLTAPVIAGLVAVAPVLLPVMWGARWQPAVPLLQILALSALPQCLMGTTGALYQSLGRTRQMFVVGAAVSALTVVSFAIGIHWGARGVAVAWLVRCWVLAPWVMSAAGRLVGLSAVRIGADGLRTALAAGLMGGGVALLSDVLDVPDGWLLAAQVGLGLLLFPPLLLLLDRPVVQEALALVRRTPTVAA